MNKLEKVATDYLNQNKQKFLNNYTDNIESLDEKTAIFTAGMSGVGKTELGVFFKETNPNILHIDTDSIRDFFKPIGYNGQNSNLFQKVASRGFNELFNYALKQGYSIFEENINLHFIDKRNDNFYENIDEVFIKNKIGEYFEIE